MDDQLDRVIEQVCRDSDMPLPVSKSVSPSIIHFLISEVGKSRKKNNNLLYCMACVCSRYNARSDWLNMPLFSRYAHGAITGLQKPSKKPYNKQLFNLERSVFTRNLKPQPYRINLALDL